MIRHICMFTLMEDKAANAAEFCQRAEALREIDGLRHFEVVCNDPRTPDSNYDVALIFDFDTVETLNFYQQHPIHKAFGAFVGTIRESRACIDYEL